MFKKSVIEDKQGNAPAEGRIVFDGYETVRTAPKSPPRNLKQRIKAGGDVINIWFQHAHAELFKDMEEWRDIRVISKASKGQVTLPTIHDMTTEEILEFCKSIDVHPAHLIPLDQDKSLSLPTPLLELLIEMAYNVKAGRGFDQNTVYLARAAIAMECRRVRQDLGNDKKIAFQNNGNFSTLAQAFTDVLSDPKTARDVAKTTIVTPSKHFASSASRSYPYVDRVHDIAVIQAEIVLEQSSHVKRIKTEIYQQRINTFKMTYHKIFGTDASDDIEAINFLGDVLDAFEGREQTQEAPNIGEVAVVVGELLERHTPFIKMYHAANDVYTNAFGRRRDEMDEQEDAYLFQMEDAKFGDLVASIQQVFDGEHSLIKAEKKHEEREGQYILRVGKIREAFDGIGNGYQRNLLNNRVLLSLHNINVVENVAPQASPK